MNKKLISKLTLDRLTENEAWLKWLKYSHRKLLDEQGVIVHTIGKHHYIRVKDLNRYLSKVIPKSVQYVVDELTIVFNDKYGEQKYQK